MDLFIKNKYTRWYFNIISNAKHREIDVYTEMHHVVPVCFYVKNRSKGRRPGWIDGDPDKEDNLVRLTPREHFVCHWLLTKMMDNKHARIKMEHALSSFRRSLKFNGLSLSSLEYQRLKIAYITSNKGRIRSPSPLKGKKQVGPKKHWWNNGEIESKSETFPGTGWIQGRLPSPLKGRINKSSQGSTWWNNGTIEKMSRTCPSDGWKSGRIERKNKASGRKGKSYGPLSDMTKEKISIANKGRKRSMETRNRMSLDRKGRKTIVKGTKYWTDGKIEVRRAESPGEGWVLGRKKNQVDGR